MVGLCAYTPGSHLDQLKHLAALLDDEDLIDRFISCEDIDQLHALLKERNN
jgi:mannitol/fructose-specific phosphotransferase system IIA component (Ntr-type)